MSGYSADGDDYGYAGEQTSWDADFHLVLSDIAEADAAEEWLDGFERLCAMGVLDQRHDRDTPIAEIRRLMGYLS